MARQSKATARARERAALERRRRDAERKKNMRTGVLGGGAVAVVVLVLVVTWPSPDPARAAADAASVLDAENWDLPALDGDGRVRLADLRGKPTVAVFFANWCDVCEEEMPLMATFSRNLADQVNFVGINMMDNAQGLSDAERWGVAGLWPLARDVGNGNNSALAVQTFGARGSPLHVIYDAEGRIVFRNNGGLLPADVLSILQSEGLL